MSGPNLAAPVSPPTGEPPRVPRDIDYTNPQDTYYLGYERGWREGRARGFLYGSIFVFCFTLAGAIMRALLL